MVKGWAAVRRNTAAEAPPLVAASIAIQARMMTMSSRQSPKNPTPTQSGPSRFG